MPVHLNGLLAEAEVPNDQIVELNGNNGKLGLGDVAIILGVKDLVNPATHMQVRSTSWRADP